MSSYLPMSNPEVNVQHHTPDVGHSLESLWSESPSDERRKFQIMMRMFFLFIVTGFLIWCGILYWIIDTEILPMFGG